MRMKMQEHTVNNKRHAAHQDCCRESTNDALLLEHCQVAVWPLVVENIPNNSRTLFSPKILWHGS